MAARMKKDRNMRILPKYAAAVLYIQSESADLTLYARQYSASAPLRLKSFTVS